MRGLARRNSARALSGASIAVILGVAAYLRIAELDLSWFSTDQVRDAVRALGIVSGQAFPLVGPEVDGGPSHTWGPLYFYLLAIPFALARDPVVATAFLSLLNLGAVYLTYRFGSAFFGRGVGLIAAALFATYPFAVVSARAMWNIAPVPLFACGFFYCVFAAVVRHRSAMIVPALLILACLLQLHLSTVALGAVLALGLLLFRPPIARRHLVLGVVGFILALSPYLWVALRSAPREAGGLLERIAAPSAGDIPWLVRQVYFSSTDLSVWMAERLGHHGGAPAWPLLSLIESTWLLLGALYPTVRLGAAWVAGRSLRTPAMTGHALLALWLWLPFLVISLRRTTIPYYYFDLLYPAPFIAAGIVFRDAREQFRGSRWRAWSGGVAVVLVALIAISQIAALRRLWAVVASEGGIPIPMDVVAWGSATARPEGRIMPMRYKARLVRAIAARTGADRAAYYRRVHGTTFEDLLQDKGFFFDSLARAPGETGLQSPASPIHVAILGRNFDGGNFMTAGGERVGPFTVVGYRPFIDYGSFAFAHPEREGDAPGPEAGRWTPFDVPTRAIPEQAVLPLAPQFAWSRVPVLIRGDVVMPRGAPDLALVLSIVDREGSEHRVDWCRVNDRLASPRRRVRYHALAGINSEIAFDASRSLREGRNTFVCRISGRGAFFDLDVYEVRAP